MSISRRSLGVSTDRMPLRLRHVVALVVMAQLADVVTTVYAIDAGHIEQNPLNEWVLRTHGSLGLLAGKGLAVLVIVTALSRIPTRLACATGLATVAATTLVALSNARFT